MSDKIETFIEREDIWSKWDRVTLFCWLGIILTGICVFPLIMRYYGN